MRKLLFAIVSLSFGLSTYAADPCGSKSIKVGSNDLELIKITEKPEKSSTGQDIKGEEKVLVSGIYMFVRNGQTWNVYRCADDVKRDSGKNPVFNLNNCVIKNDFEFGNLVKRYGNSGITVRKTDSNRLEIRLNVAGNEELDYYDVKSNGEGLEVIQNKYKENKQQRYLSRHEPVSLGTCTKASARAAAGSSQGKTNAPRATNKVNSGN